MRVVDNEVQTQSACCKYLEACTSANRKQWQGVQFHAHDHGVTIVHVHKQEKRLRVCDLVDFGLRAVSREEHNKYRLVHRLDIPLVSATLSGVTHHSVYEDIDAREERTCITWRQKLPWTILSWRRCPFPDVAAACSPSFCERGFG